MGFVLAFQREKERGEYAVRVIRVLVGRVVRLSSVEHDAFAGLQMRHHSPLHRLSRRVPAEKRRPVGIDLFGNATPRAGLSPQLRGVHEITPYVGTQYQNGREK